MKRIISGLITCFLCLSISHVMSSQVYLSKIYNDVVILGPDNVAPHNFLIANNYIGEIQVLYTSILDELEAVNEAAKAILAIDAPTEIQKKQLSEYQSDINLIEREMTFLMEFKSMWLDIANNEGMKEELLNLQEKGSCFDINTSEGYVSANDFVITTDKDLTRIKVVEHFSITYKEKLTTLEKRRSDKNCFSDNPEDCIVWCEVQIPGGNVLTDITGDTYLIDGSGLEQQYELDPQYSRVKRTIVLELESGTTDLISIIRKENNTLLQLTNWKEVSCE